HQTVGGTARAVPGPNLEDPVPDLELGASDFVPEIGGIGSGATVGYRLRVEPPHDLPLMMPMLAALAAVTLLTMPSPVEDERRGLSPFVQRGYYITFMRMPTYDLADWRRIVDGIHDDRGNTLLLWVAGAFRSEKY